MEGPKHYPYPRTAHIEGSNIVDDDEAVSNSSCKSMIQSADCVVVQEKVDGTNVGVHFEEDWVPVCQKRSGVIGQGEHEQYVRFRDWVYGQVEDLWTCLNTRYVLYGEYLLAVHGVSYDALPSFFLAFDVWDKQDKCWLSWDRMQKLLEPCQGRISCVPLLSRNWNGDLKELEALVQKSKFSTTETAEGVYIRFEKGGVVQHRLKYRRKTFTAGRKDFHTHMKTNSLKKE